MGPESVHLLRSARHIPIQLEKVSYRQRVNDVHASPPAEFLLQIYHRNMSRIHLMELREIELRCALFVLFEPFLYRQNELPRSFVVQHQAERKGKISSVSSRGCKHQGEEWSSDGL